MQMKKMILQIVVVISLLWAGCAGRGEISEEKAQLLPSATEDRSLEQTTTERDLPEGEIPEEQDIPQQDILERDPCRNGRGIISLGAKCQRVRP